jgi:hypothetical protein
MNVRQGGVFLTAPRLRLEGVIRIFESSGESDFDALSQWTIF